MNRLVQQEFIRFAVVDEKLIACARALILDMYRLPVDMTYFPGALPVSLMRKDLLPYLTEMPYMVAEKTDGVRYLMLVFRYHEGDGRVYSLLVDRGFRFYYTFIKFNRSLTEGTLFDGEIILEPTGYKFYVHDLVCVSGDRTVALQSYQRRMHYVTEILRWQCFPPSDPAQDLLAMYPKQVFPISELTTLWTEVIPKLPHRCDGLIFTPNNIPHTGKKNKLLFKWKAPSDNTIDLQLGPPVNEHTDTFLAPTTSSASSTGGGGLDGLGPPYVSYSLLTWDTSQYFHFCEIAMSPERWRAIEIADPSQRYGTILECKFDFSRNMWVPENIRQDKVVPNDVVTIRRTIESIMENLTIDELLNLSRHAKSSKGLVYEGGGGGVIGGIANPNMIYDPDSYYSP